MPAQAQVRTDGLTVLGTPALPVGFAHLPYVNPDAPKGGEVTFAQLGAYDGFNPYILRGRADMGVTGSWMPGVGMNPPGATAGHVWESLLQGSADEVATAYCHLCRAVVVAPDRLSVTFTMRPEARFADGTAVTAADVRWSFDTLREKGNPALRVTLSDVLGADVVAPDTVRFRFRTAENRDLPLLVGGLPVFPEHWWQGRDFARPLTEAPMGSGPYRVESFELGRSVTYALRPDWWARDMPTGRGLANFGRVHEEYYRDATVAMQAFRAGAVDVRQENIARQWATGYDFPAVEKGLVRRRSIPHHLPTGMQGIAMNERRPQFADPRVRQALTLAFDFEWENRTLFYGAYARTLSYFSNSDLAATGLPMPGELALLEPYRAQLPPALFTQPFTLPVTSGDGNNRAELRGALDLLHQAGWEVRDRRLVDKDGQPLRLVILLDDPSYERATLPYVAILQRLGVDASVRVVDLPQYVELMNRHDFDMTLVIVPQGDVPGNEERDDWSCEAARTEGSANASGVCSPVVDALVAKVVTATDRAGLVDAARALDRVLLWGWHMVPGWHTQTFNLAWWDVFGMPEQPVREGFVLDAWWVDPAPRQGDGRAAARGAVRRREEGKRFFFEKKKQKTLVSWSSWQALSLPAGRWNSPLGSIPTNQSLFASFSSEKEDACLPPFEAALRPAAA